MKICIDPGHGGKDPGAVGKKGTKEKDVTLAISKKLKYVLEDGINAKVVLTRSSDVLPWGDKGVLADLQARCNIANNNNVNIFLSIHCNSSTNINAKGAETYYYKESRYGFRLAFEIQKSIVDLLNLTNRGIKYANFYVLKRTKMPAALIECGFISNPAEELLLIDNNFQTQLAMAIADGVSNFQKIIDKK